MDVAPQLQEALGWQFKDESLLLEALTHSTYVNENPDGANHNERMEFLGDAVVGLLTAEILYSSTEQREGMLTRRRASVVSRKGLAKLAYALNLPVYLRMGAGTQENQITTNTVSDAYEALMGAVFLDGGYEAVSKCFGPTLRETIAQSEAIEDFKTELQEFCHRKGWSLPEYNIASTSGPDHSRNYICEVTVNNEVRGRGKASSKKKAEQVCAEAALEELKS